MLLAGRNFIANCYPKYPFFDPSPFLAIVQEQLVSKRDLQEMGKELALKVEGLRNEVKMDIEKVRFEIENVKKDLKICFGGMLVVAVTVLSGMMTLVVHLAR